MSSKESNSTRSPDSMREESITPDTTPISNTTTDTTTTTTTTTIAKMPPSSATVQGPTSTKKRAAAGEPNAPTKVTKRRAARACVSCRARKVRCDVVEKNPCGNCRWDGVECVVQESRRRRKGPFDLNSSAHISNLSMCAPHPAHAEAHLRAKTTPSPIAIAPLRRPIISNDANHSGAGGRRSGEIHVPPQPHCQQSNLRPDPVLLPALPANTYGSRYPNIWPNPNGPNNQAPVPAPAPAATPATPASAEPLRTRPPLKPIDEIDVSIQQPGFLRPLPQRIASEDVAYLRAKGALSVPSLPVQSALLRAYVEYVHPYMPLLDLHDFLSLVDARDGSRGQTSLFLYQAVMFCATAFVSNKVLKEAGYSSRKAARRAFFTKARLLYDFDYENDRLLLVQGLLLMTYWYETPDDQKDTWHWMGVAISLGHTIGLHRNPANTNMSPPRQKLWKRIWWSCFMRDRLVALGMRRPTRIKDEDFDVPMLEEADFDFAVLPEEVQVVDPQCTLLRDVGMQRELAQMCIAKAKLSLCISHMLKAQYSVLACTKTHENTTNSTMMLLPNKQLDNMDSITRCDVELTKWAESLPESCRYRPLSLLDIQNGRGVVAVQRNLLHMVYFTTMSALYRPLFLPSSPHELQQTSSQVQQTSRVRVCTAAIQITRMVAELNTLHLDKYLPTTGVTVLLPALIIHMIEMKNPSSGVRIAAYKGFRQCMRVMERLRDIYSAADYAVAFVNAAMRKGAQVTTSQQPAPPSFDVGSNHGPPPPVAELKATVMPSYSAPATMPMPMPTVATPPPEPMLFPSSLEDDTPILLSDPTFTSDMTRPFAPPPGAMPSSFNSNMTIDTSVLVPHEHAVAHSPPTTDIMTPDSSAPSPYNNRKSIDSDWCLDMVERDAQTPQEFTFDWNALSGPPPNIDFDQWLQFPPGEGAAVGPGMGLNVGDDGLVALGSQIEGSSSSDGNFGFGPITADITTAEGV
ncbi:fungal-specific transcription factor domain-containing protein [Xylariaceae sp. FL0594]|nr:fungal-specific transcription factor domain-containing protein [Xylariaceae sp. FL0594]